MRPATLLMIGAAVLSATGCPSPTFRDTVAIGGGTGARVLAFVVEPSNAAAGAIIAPAIQVAVEDSTGTVDSTATGGVTVALTSSGGATLSGTTTVTLAAGISVFSDLNVNLAGTYTLTATSSGRSSATSTAFTIN
jgi:hypothetical protein